MSFRIPWWLPGKHPQSLWGPYMRPRSLVACERERLETPDGDDLWLDHLPGPAGSPRLILLHGLEGSSFSPYVQGMMVLAQRRGWRAVGFNCRSCAREQSDTITWIPNRRPWLYHSGETGDFDFVMRELQRREPHSAMLAIGVSMGGNMLLKWLGENPGQDLISAAAAVSAPFDLGAGARHLETRIGRIYVDHFLQSMRVKVENMVTRHPELRQRLDVERALRARDFRPFDEAITAPLHGFADADDFYRRGSAIHYLDRITTPTLCLNAEDDPIIPRAVLPQVRARASAAVETLFTRRGGHVGFVMGQPWQPQYWAEEMVIEWLGKQAASPPAGLRGQVPGIRA